MISHEPPPGAVAPLSIWPTIVEAYRLVFSNLAALAKIAVLPFVLVVLLGGLGSFLGPFGQSMAWEFGIELPWTLMAVAWLRFLLLGPAAGDAAVFPHLRARHLRFLGYALVLSLINLPLTLLPYLSDGPDSEAAQRTLETWLLYAVILYIQLRFCFVYAAAAVDERYSLAHAWRHTRGISLTLFVAVGLAVALPWEAATWLLGQAMQANSAGAVAAWLLWHAGLWVLEALYLAFFVIAFRRCTGWVPAPDQGVLERFE